jgi:iron(III) transport system substrate-binding protein
MLCARGGNSAWLWWRVAGNEEDRHDLIQARRREEMAAEFRRFVQAALSTLALSFAVAAAPVHAQSAHKWLDPALLAAARAEGTLTVYSSTNEQEGLPLFKIFEEATGIKFDYIRGNDASLLSRVAIETRAGQPSFDIIHISNAHKMPPQMLAEVDLTEAKNIFPQARDPNRRWFGVYTVYNTPAYNTDKVKASDLPKTFEELAQRKEWAGRVALEATDIEWLKGILQHYGEDKGKELVRTIVTNLKPVLTDGRLAMARSVGAGEYLLALNNFANLSLNVKLAGAPIDIFPLDPVALFYAQVAVNAKAPHPNAARLAANFMLSQECQAFYTKFGRLPTRSDVPTNPPGIVDMITQKKVVATLFDPPEEARLRQTFNALFRQR